MGALGRDVISGWRRGRARRSTLALCVIAGLVVTMTIPATARSRPGAVRQPDVKVGLWGPGGCAALMDELPSVVAMDGAEPGDTSSLVRVCVKNTGSAAGRLTLGALDVTDVETACSPGETEVDPTCGGGQDGEMSASVYELAAVTDRCGADRPRPDLINIGRLSAGSRLLVEVLQPGKSACLTLAIAYLPVSHGSAGASQTDRLSWRYGIDLTSR
ncbi:MAG: hypothetical protein ACRDV1_10065 [Actinomycetes bacterium]